MGNLQIVQVQKTGFKSVQLANCALWSRCVKHVENMHYLHDPKDVEEALANPKAHWDNLEDRKARLWGVDTRLQGWSTLNECVGEYGAWEC